MFVLFYRKLELTKYRMIVVATFALNVAQPGPIFEAPVRKSVSAETSTDKV